jgi:hypothetical protein
LGVGMTPPNVDAAPKPVSSVMIRRTFGAPFGGTTRGAHAGFDWSALSSIWPVKGAGGGGSCRPSIVEVALGEPGVPVTCCANDSPLEYPVTHAATIAGNNRAQILMAMIYPLRHTAKRKSREL